MDTEEGFCIFFALPDGEVVLRFPASVTSYIAVVVFLIDEALNESVIAQQNTLVSDNLTFPDQQLKHGICHWDNEREAFCCVIEQFPVHVDAQIIYNDMRRGWEHCAGA